MSVLDKLKFKPRSQFSRASRFLPFTKAEAELLGMTTKEINNLSYKLADTVRISVLQNFEAAVLLRDAEEDEKARQAWKNVKPPNRNSGALSRPIAVKWHAEIEPNYDDDIPF